MKYKDELQQLCSKIQGKKDLLSAIFNIEKINIKFFLSLFRRQKLYLFWVSSLLILQLIEIGILAWAHFIFFPPESLNVLRALSSFSFIGIIAAVNVRFLSPSVRGRPQEEKARLLFASQALFVFGLFISLLCAVYVACYTNLSFTASPIYRAVLVSGIVALPFDIFTTFITYNYSRFNIPPMRSGFRLFALSSYFVSLLFLLLDMPIGYLSLVLLPRFSFAGYLWRRISTREKFSFFTFGLKNQVQNWKIFWQFTKGASPVILIFIGVEFSLFIIYRGLTFHDSELAFVIYFCHKLIHVAVILGIKSNLLFARSLNFMSFIGDKSGINKSLRILRLITLFYIGTALLLLPLLLLKNEVLIWASPIGDYFELSLIGFLLSLVLVSSRSFLLVSSTWLLQKSGWKKPVFYTLAASFLLSVSSYYLTDYFLINFDLVGVFEAYVLIDACFAFILSSLIVRRLLFSSQEKEQETSRRSLNYILSKHKLSKEQNSGLYFLELWEGTKNSIFECEENKGIAAQLSLGDSFCRINSTKYVLLIERASQNECQDFIKRILKQYAAYIKNITLAERQIKQQLLAFAFPFMHQDEITKESVAIFEQIKQHLREGCIQNLSLNKDSDSFSILIKGETWEPSIISRQDVRNSVYSYLSLLKNNNDNLGIASRDRRNDGVVQLNNNGQAKLIIYLEKKNRAQLAELRQMAVLHNLDDLL